MSGLSYQEMESVLSRIRYKRMTLSGRRDSDSDFYLVKLMMRVTDVHTGYEMPLHSDFHVHPEQFETAEKFARYIFDKCLEFEHHEAAEWFTLDGEALFNPHKDEVHFQASDLRPKIYKVWDDRELKQRESVNRYDRLFGPGSFVTGNVRVKGTAV